MLSGLDFSGKVLGDEDEAAVLDDFGDDNCTNFISQILARGGMSLMLNGQTGYLDESWWYHHGEAYGKGPVRNE